MIASIDPFVWSLLLMLVGCALIALEVFIPSGGVLGFLAATSIFTAIALAFYHRGPAAGLALVITSVILLPASLALAIKIWPSTPMGRRFLLGLPTRDEVTPDDPRQRALKALVGRTGRARSPMLPSGAIVIDGVTIDAISQGMPIDADQSVIVVEVKGNRVVVRPCNPSDRPEAIPEKDILDQPLDALGLDPLDDPLA